MKLLLALAALLPLAASSETAPPATNPQDCVDPSEYPAGTDFFPDKFVPHATTDLLEIEYHNTYKIVKNKFQDKSYLLYQCGTEPPAEEAGKHHLTLSVPHKGGVGITETPQIPPMELLALRGEIAGYIGNPKLVSSPCLNHLMSEGDVETVYDPEDPWNNDATGFLEANPDAVVFAGPYGNADAEGHLGVAASQEKTAVATFDWLGMYAALFNLESEANQIIADTEGRYQCSAGNAAALTADVQPEARPRILWAQYFASVQGGSWSVADCPTWDEAYYCEYAAHCGAELVSRPEGLGFSESYDGGKTLYWYLTDEDMLELGKDVDTWIYPGSTFEDVYRNKKEMLDQFKSVQNKNVYDTQGQGPNSWHEQRLAEYDIVALDVCTLVGTNNPDTIHRRRWIRNYFNEQMEGLGGCNTDEIDMAYIPAQAQCTPIGGEAPASQETPQSPATAVGLELAAALVAGAMAAFMG